MALGTLPFVQMFDPGLHVGARDREAPVRVGAIDRKPSIELLRKDDVNTVAHVNTHGRMLARARLDGRLLHNIAA